MDDTKAYLKRVAHRRNSYTVTMPPEIVKRHHIDENCYVEFLPCDDLFILKILKSEDVETREKTYVQ